MSFSISGNLFKGIGIASIGALILSPDVLFMRWSEMDVWSMLTWRGLEMGIILILFSSCFRIFRTNFKHILSPVGFSIIFCQIISSFFFYLWNCRNFSFFNIIYFSNITYICVYILNVYTWRKNNKINMDYSLPRFNWRRNFSC